MTGLLGLENELMEVYNKTPLWNWTGGISLNPSPSQNHGSNICPALRKIKTTRSRIARKSAGMDQSPPQAEIF